MKKFWIVLLAVFATGCATGMEYAGRTEIDLENYVWLDPQGNPISRDLRLKVNSGKEQGKIDAMFEAKADGSILMIVGAEGVKAFQGQAIAGKVKNEQYNMISQTISTAIEKGIQAAKPGGGAGIAAGKVLEEFKARRNPQGKVLCPASIKTSG